MYVVVLKKWVDVVEVVIVVAVTKANIGIMAAGIILMTVVDMVAMTILTVATMVVAM